MTCPVMSCHVMSCHVMSCHGMAWHGMAWHGMACHVMSCHVMSWHGMAWHGMAWHGMSCHVMSCHSMSCNVCLCKPTYLYQKRFKSHHSSSMFGLFLPFVLSSRPLARCRLQGTARPSVMCTAGPALRVCGSPKVHVGIIAGYGIWPNFLIEFVFQALSNVPKEPPQRSLDTPLRPRRPQ